MEQLVNMRYQFRDEHISDLSRMLGGWRDNPLTQDYFVSRDIFENIQNQTKMEIEKLNE